MALLRFEDAFNDEYLRKLDRAMNDPSRDRADDNPGIIADRGGVRYHCGTPNDCRCFQVTNDNWLNGVHEWQS